VVNRTVDVTKRWSKYGFRGGFETNIDLGSANEVRKCKCRDEIEFCSEFVNLSTCFT
jgi:hypothetical protein